MLENIFCAFTAVFFVIGFVCSVYYMMLRLTRSKNGKTLIISFIGRDEENAVARIGRLLSRLALEDTPGRAYVVAVCDDGLFEIRSQLEAVFADERDLIICFRCELPEMLGISPRQT